MNTPDRPTPSTADDALRQQLRAAQPSTPAPELTALQARALEQWRQRTAAQPHAHGPLAVLQAGWRQHPALASGALLALALAALLLLKPWAQPDPTVDELLQHDVLSLMAAGEL